MHPISPLNQSYVIGNMQQSVSLKAGQAVYSNTSASMGFIPQPLNSQVIQSSGKSFVNEKKFPAKKAVMLFGAITSFVLAGVLMFGGKNKNAISAAKKAGEAIIKA